MPYGIGKAFSPTDPIGRGNLHDRAYFDDVTDELIYLPDLATAFAALYRGPLEEFISRRCVGEGIAREQKARRRRRSEGVAQAESAGHG